MAKNYNLSKDYQFNITVTDNTYAGKLALPYVTAAVKSPDTIAKGYVRQIDGLNSKAVISNLGISDPVQAAACSFSTTDAPANLALTEQVLTLADMKVNQEVCRGTVFPTWIGENMDRNGNLPGSFEDFLLSTVAAKAGAHIENMIWKGSSPFGVGFQSDDGSLDETGADASAMKDFHEVDLDGAITTADILDDLAAVYDKVVASVQGILSKPGFGFYMNHKTYALYAQKLSSATTFQSLGAAGDFNSLTYMGFPIYVCPGMFNDTIVATYPENLVVGTNLATDWTEARVIPTYQYDGSDNVRIVMNFAMGVQTAVGTDGVFATSVWT
tara:strand:+ start:12011 stop:12994 length:984 start_codon:yes stop_codon:yes gene_type:complete